MHEPAAGTQHAIHHRAARSYTVCNTDPHSTGAWLKAHRSVHGGDPTEVPFHRRAPGLSGDLLGDAISISQELGVRVIVRYDLIGLHRDAYEAHPEWFYRSHDGRPMVDKGLYMTCPNGGWWQEQFFA